ncbi:MAG TPA: DUF4231 domain-containing protein [Pseudonocardiaceae bacterium]|nr:DUF4231 domain-containing protein [Pseudonocardiaceae bacterium]
MTVQPVEDGETGPTWERLEDQLGWYDRKSVAAQSAYKRVKLSQLIVGAAVPVCAGLQVSAAITATLAAYVVVAEGAQQLYQWQTNWVLYRATAESLKHEKYLYLAAAGPYNTDDRHRVLAERLEGLVSQEHAKWTESRQKDSHTASAEPKHS